MFIVHLTFIAAIFMIMCGNMEGYIITSYVICYLCYKIQDNYIKRCIYVISIIAYDCYVLNEIGQMLLYINVSRLYIAMCAFNFISHGMLLPFIL